MHSPPLLTLLLSAGLHAAAAAPAAAAPAVAAPGSAQPVENPEQLVSWFQALAATQSGPSVARALQYGDSTLAADGLAETVRGRLQERFGDAGPGFVPASFLPMWSVRSDVVVQRWGDWTWRTILYGGGGSRYGLGGIVAILHAGDGVALRAIDAQAQTRPLRHVELWYQAGVGYGRLNLRLDDATPSNVEATAPSTQDRREIFDSDDGLAQGIRKIRLSATGGPVPVYGLVLETGQPGATWETLAVSGVGSRSFTVYAGAGLTRQVSLRQPDLIVVMLGGNEAGYPVLRVGDGDGYRPIFQGALDLIRSGKPDAACLVVSPLDQGEALVDEDGAQTGARRSKRGMANLIAQQRLAAAESDCAFWSAYDAMGGQGAAVEWTRHRGLTSGDLVHLSRGGLAVIGTRLADALLNAYDQWRASADPSPSG